MKSFKPLLIVVIALIIINCVLIGMLWYNNYSKKRPMQGNAFEYLSKELSLTPLQVQQYDVLRKQHFEFTSKVNEHMRMLRDSFFDNLKSPEASPTTVNKLEGRILTDQRMLDSATFYHFRTLRGMLHAGQQSKFDDMIKDVLHMMGQPHPPGRQHGNRPGPEGPPQDGPLQDGPQQGPPPDGPPK